jgi:hypothetical protein
MMLLMALAGFLLVPSTPLLQCLAPLNDTALLLIPAMGVCAVLGWALGGRAWIVVVWVGLAVVMLTWGGQPQSVYGALQSGWALVLVTAFGLVSAASPPATRFLPRALTALAASVSLVGLLALGTRDATGAVRRVVMADAATRPNAALAWVERTAGSPEWREWTQRSPQGSSLAAAEVALDNVLSTLPRDAVAFYPALLALESLAALALAWGLFHRVSRTRIGEPLGRLVDFRFSDQLVWGVIAGAVLVLMPASGEWRALGLNLLLFFGTLYAVRGLAVLLWYLAAAHASAAAVVALLMLAALLSAPSAIGLTLVGLSDSWGDWRARPGPASPRPMG